MVIEFLNKYRIQFENLPQQLKCCICRKILKNASQVKCGCKACKKCIIEYLKNGPKICPCYQCNCIYIISNINERENIFPDKATDKDISRIPMKCPFYCCSFTIHLKLLQHHINGCQDREIFCEICQLKMIFKHHNRFGCEIKIEYCESCADNLRFWQFHDEKQNANNNEIIKNDNCSMQPLKMNISRLLENYNFDFSNISSRLKCVICKNILKEAKQTICGCKVCNKCIKEYLANGPKNCPNNEEDCANVVLHIDQDINQDNATNKEIVNLTVKCPFKNCQYENHLKFIEKHVNECEYREIICGQCKKQDFNFPHFDCKEDKMKKDDLMKHMEHREIKHSSSLISKIKEMGEAIESLSNKINIQQSINKELEEIYKKNQEFQINTERVIKELSNKIPNIISNIKNECTNRNGNFIWKFSEFDKHLINAERGEKISFTSDPFYTSEFGYRMCLRNYPAGDGIGKGTHLSVFFAIMKGEFDDLLTWPFKQKVTLSILDQEYSVKHHSETFKPDSRTMCYQKPKDACNVASGSPKFIHLSLINNNSPYCRNNTIYFKISVDTNGISKP